MLLHAFHPKFTGKTRISFFVILFCVFGILTCSSCITHAVDPFEETLRELGFSEKHELINSVDFSYVEGPDNGPPLVLLHAQHMDWFSYSRVMPELSRSFHIFDIDYPGHGLTSYPPDYPMNAQRIGTDLGDFVEAIIGEPAYITGNSSGGLLTTWLAANRPELVRAILLEDPPLFSAEYPRIQNTIAYRSFTTSYEFVQDDADDFLLYWIDSNSKFFDNNVGKGSAGLLTNAVLRFRKHHPGQAVNIGLISNDTVRLLIRGLDEYDARFGAAFYDGSWNENFDHGKALERIQCPVLLLHAHYEILEDGTLNGAMSEEDAQHAMELLNQGTYRNIDATHVVHLDKPEEFIQILTSFFQAN